MTLRQRTRRPRRAPLLSSFVALLLLLPGAALAGDDAASLGRRMYREGLLPSGEPMEAVVQGDIPVLGTALTCANCHVRSGLGSIEGGVMTTPTNGARLFQPYSEPSALPLATRERRRMVSVAPPPRPAYTDTTLAAALGSGVDPTGRELNPIMPRYHLDEPSTAALIAYLKTLSSETSPGANEKEVRFATVVHKDVPQEERRALLEPLEIFVKNRNRLAVDLQNLQRYKANPARHRMTAMGLTPLTYRSFSLAVWELSGPPEGWKAQLDAHYRKEPVFALVGGLAPGEWRPIHEFCEERQLPCLLPMTDYPVVAPRDWYTLYFSKGFYQEGETAARYLSKAEGLAAGTAVVQLFRDDPQGRALAAGFRDTWRKRGENPLVERSLAPGTPVTGELVTRLASEEKAGALLLWLGPEGQPALEMLASRPDRPAHVFASGGALGDSLWQLSKNARAAVLVTYPFRPPQDQDSSTRGVGVWLKGYKVQQDSHRVATRAYALVMLLNDVLGEMRQNWYRDYLLDLVDIMSPDEGRGPDYVRLSFGPGQRYASKGCYVVRVSPDPGRRLEKLTDWVVP